MFPVATWYNCMPSVFVQAFTTLLGLDVNFEYRWNVIVYQVAIDPLFDPADTRWKNTWEAMFKLVFILQNPPENSYIQGDPTLWSALYAQHALTGPPNQDCCALLRFPANQGGAWPIRWPDSPPCP